MERIGQKAGALGLGGVALLAMELSGPTQEHLEYNEGKPLTALFVFLVTTFGTYVVLRLTEKKPHE